MRTTKLILEEKCKSEDAEVKKMIIRGFFIKQIEKSQKMNEIGKENI